MIILTFQLIKLGKRKTFKTIDKMELEKQIRDFLKSTFNFLIENHELSNQEEVVKKYLEIYKSVFNN